MTILDATPEQRYKKQSRLISFLNGGIFLGLVLLIFWLGGQKNISENTQDVVVILGFIMGIAAMIWLQRRARCTACGLHPGNLANTGGYCNHCKVQLVISKYMKKRLAVQGQEPSEKQRILMEFDQQRQRRKGLRMIGNILLVAAMGVMLVVARSGVTAPWLTLAFIMMLSAVGLLTYERYCWKCPACGKNPRQWYMRYLLGAFCLKCGAQLLEIAS